MKSVDPGWAWSPYEPGAERPWTLSLAGHLYRRAAFGANDSQLRRALAVGPQRAIDNLLKPAGDPVPFNRAYDNYEAGVADSNSTDELRAWWLRRMILTPHPLLEKMTLFWHHHFATSNSGVQSMRLMRQNVQKLRGQALGSFREMLKAMSLDPALLAGLGAVANRKALPNEHFAQLLLEDYTVGPGQFNQKDIQEVARAFTGWFVLQGELRYTPREHDENNKVIFGKPGNYSPTEVVDLILEQPAAAETVVRQLYRWLISERENPDQELIAPLITSFARAYEVLPLVQTMLRSNLFFSPSAYRQRIKCPVEYALGVIVALEGTVSTTQLGQDLAQLGQNLYHPPTPKGWIGGQHWINQATLAGRHNLALALTQGSGPYGNGLHPWEMANKHQGDSLASMSHFLEDLFFQGDLEPQIRASLLGQLQSPGDAGQPNLELQARRLTQALITLPEFQLA